MNNKKNNIAIALFSFNRPDYLKQVISSLEKNIEIEDIDFYMFQDGAINKFSNRVAADEKDINKCIIEWLVSTLPNKTLIRNEYNLGIGITQYNAKVFLFDEMKYEKVIFLEDDLVLSKYYIRLIKIMLNNYKDDSDVGGVTCHGIGYNKDKVQKEKDILKLTYGVTHLWGWATWKNRWEKIKPFFQEYYSFINEMDYRDRAYEKILSFYKNKGFKINASSQDAGMYYSLFSNNYLIINTMVNRGEYIGVKGEHMTPELFKSNACFYSKLDELDNDCNITNFDDIDKVAAFECVRKILLIEP